MAPGLPDPTAAPPPQNIEQEYLGGHADALEPLGISYQHDDGSLDMGNQTVKQNRDAMRYLTHVFGVVDFYFCEPFVVLGCDPTVPEGRLPQSVGGLIAIWRHADDMDFMPCIGHVGQMEEEMEINPSLLVGFEPNRIPTDDAIAGLATYVFPDCEAITFLMGSLVVELPKSEDQTFWARLQRLPWSIMHAPFSIKYHNGPVPNTERRRREKHPKPQLAKDKHIADKTDYVAKDGKFYPGTMISSTDENGNMYSSVSAGVLVRKGDEHRLVCPWHCWSDHNDKYPGLMGTDDNKAKDVFDIVQGENGTKVGYVNERIGDTDIALAKLNDGIVFQNTFMDINAVPKRFLHSDHVSMGNVFYIDGFSTGKQRLVSLGRRFEITRKPGQPHRHLIAPNNDDSLLPPDNIAYVCAKQGVCGTGEPTLTTKPYIRDSACGAVLLRCGMGRKSGETETTTMARGEICGIFHFADLTMRNTAAASTYIIYTDAFDPLIEAGWTIVPAPGEIEESNVTGNVEDVAEESPSKRLRIR